METEMLSCPFCGEAGMIRREQRANGKYFPQCSNERCIAANMVETTEWGVIYVKFETVEAAVAAWNTRKRDARSTTCVTAASTAREIIWGYIPERED